MCDSVMMYDSGCDRCFYTCCYPRLCRILFYIYIHIYHIYVVLQARTTFVIRYDIHDSGLQFIVSIGILYIILKTLSRPAAIRRPRAQLSF